MLYEVITNALSAEIGVQITEIGTITDSGKISMIDETGPPAEPQAGHRRAVSNPPVPECSS